MKIAKNVSFCDFFQNFLLNFRAIVVNETFLGYFQTLWSRLIKAHCLKITQNVAFEFWHFPSIFVLLKLNCLVTLFDRKLQILQKLAKMNHFWHF